MPVGTIKSFSFKKGYGFIESEGGEFFFFHISKVRPDSRTKVAIGSVVSFDEKPEPKGMAAVSVAVHQESSKLYVSPKGSKVFVSKTEFCGKKNKIVYKHQRVTVEDKDPDKAVELLKEKAKEAGFNAVVNLKRGRRTGSKGNNYKYSIHILSAEPALVKQVHHTLDLDRAAANKKALEQERQRLSEQQIEDNLITTNWALVLIIAAALLIFVLAF